MEKPILIAQDGSLQGQHWAIDAELLLGRDESCGLVIPDRQISRQHAIIKSDGSVYLLEDLGSKNGTFLNGQRIENPQVLHEGDEIRLAFTHTFVFLSSDSTLPLNDLPLEVISRFALKLEEGSRRVWIQGVELDPPLSSQQFSLLLALYQRTGEVVSREELISAVWGTETQWVTEQAFDALVRRLRDRINQIDPDYDYIVTVRGHGLRLENHPH